MVSSFRSFYVCVETAADILKNGGVLIFPTETFYALGALVSASEAVEKIAFIKRRPPGKPFPALADSVERLEEWAFVSALPPRAREFWPGPLTALLPARKTVCSRLINPENKMALRVTSHPIAAALSRLCECPIVCTSANLAGHKAPLYAFDIAAALLAAALPIVARNEAETPLNSPSTLVEPARDRDGTPGLRILRQGVIDKRALENKELRVLSG